MQTQDMCSKGEVIINKKTDKYKILIVTKAYTKTRKLIMDYNMYNTIRKLTTEYACMYNCTLIQGFNLNCLPNCFP